MKTYKRVLSIAGSDSGGGAGVQADLKAISACGCFAMTAITAVTAQNTLGVRAIEPLPVNVIEAQIRACLDDIGVDAIKIGMLHSVEVIQTVCPNVSPIAPNKMDFPAPVSPVIIVNPFSSSIFVLSIKA